VAEVIFEGKAYKDIDIDSQNALHVVNIHSFRYFPKDRIWMASDVFAEFFGVNKFYKINSIEDGPKLVAPEDTLKDRDMYRKLISGEETVVSYEVRFRGSYELYKITLAVLERDNDGRPDLIAGIIENYDDRMMQSAVTKMLANDYFSVYYVDFVRNEVLTYKMLESIQDRYMDTMSKRPTYEAAIGKYIEEDVVEEERVEMHEITSRKYLAKQLNEKLAYIHDYRILRNGIVHFMRFKAVKLNEGNELNQIVVGFADVSEEKQNKLARLAYFDQVTLGNNYNYFSENLRKENRTGYIVSLDIRDFKIVNDVCGIRRGDEVLREVNRILEDVIGGEGYFGHVNGDHFVFFLPITDENDVVKVLELITNRFAEMVVTNSIPKISPYFGVTKWRPGQRIQVIFSEANTAKHKIKASKTTNYGFYTEADNAEAIEIKKMEDAFDVAIENKQFEVWYQPKFSPAQKELTGAEALVRWRLDDGKLVSPGRFIPVFERNGMIRRLDEYVFRNVCAKQKEWLDSYGETISVSVNLSRASLSHETIVEEYKAIADEYGIPAEIIPIEITESAAISNSDIKELADRFFNAGFLMHIDDFGTGYSSLSTLNLMRFDTLKLDKSLVDYIGEFGGDRLVKHTTALAKDLGLYVVAEGVEEDYQLEFLKDIECDSIQGYIFSKPILAAEFEEILKNEKKSKEFIYCKNQ